MTTPTDDDDETEHDRLRLARRLRGLTQAELAEEAEVDHLSVSRHENGGPISKRILPRYASALGVTEAWLRFGVGPGPAARTTQIVNEYLASRAGLSTPEWVIPLLRKVSYRSLGVSRVTTGHVHRVRELIELNRAVDPTMPKNVAARLPKPKPPRSRR